MVWEQFLVEALTSDKQSNQPAQIEDLNVSKEVVRLNIHSELTVLSQMLDQFEEYQDKWNSLSEEDKRKFKEDLENEIDIDKARGELEKSEYYSELAEDKYLQSVTYQSEGMLSSKVYEANLDKLSLLTGEERHTIIAFYSHLEALKNVLRDFKELSNEKGLTRRNSVDIDTQMRRESLKNTIEGHLEACQENCENAINLLEKNI